MGGRSGRRQNRIQSVEPVSLESRRGYSRWFGQRSHQTRHKVVVFRWCVWDDCSHCSDIVGPNGLVYAVEFSHRSGRDLVNIAKKRTNVIPIIEDARHPQKYRMLVGMVDTVFADVAQPDQARIVALNAQYFLKQGGNFIVSIKSSCIDSTAAPEAVFAREVKKLQEDGFKPKEQLTLEPYERDHAIVVGAYRVSKK